MAMSHCYLLSKIEKYFPKQQKNYIRLIIDYEIQVTKIRSTERQSDCTVKIKWHTRHFAARFSRFKSRLSSDRNKNDIKDG